MKTSVFVLCGFLVCAFGSPVSDSNPDPQYADLLASAAVAHAVEEPVPVVVNTQFHAQSELGEYSYGYSNPTSSKFETKSADGTVEGTYSYLSPDGRVITNNYVSQPGFGFRSSLAPANGDEGVLVPVAVPEVPPVPVQGPVDPIAAEVGVAVVDAYNDNIGSAVAAVPVDPVIADIGIAVANPYEEPAPVLQVHEAVPTDYYAEPEPVHVVQHEVHQSPPYAQDVVVDHHVQHIPSHVEHHVEHVPQPAVHAIEHHVQHVPQPAVHAVEHHVQHVPQPAVHAVEHHVQHLPQPAVHAVEHHVQHIPQPAVHVKTAVHHPAPVVHKVEHHTPVVHKYSPKPVIHHAAPVVHKKSYSPRPVVKSLPRKSYGYNKSYSYKSPGYKSYSRSYSRPGYNSYSSGYSRKYGYSGNRRSFGYSRYYH